ncbi:MAG: hypothetical protein MJK14_03600 [Rivularia sp. ALOHA_DT_140]|nr:hypothetical protein [Rivularia sp. ALOHA_DT_140]
MKQILNQQKSALTIKGIASKAAVFLSAGMMLLTGNVAKAETVDIPVSKTVLTAGMNAYLQGVEVNLDTWDKWNGKDWYKNNYYILINGSKKPIKIDRSPTVQTTFRRYNGYVNDLRSQTISVKQDGKKFKFNVFFENAGDELKIGCINRRKDKPCKAHLLKHSGQVNNAQITAWLEPVLSNGKISFKQPQVKFDFDLKPDSWILSKAKNIADRFVDTNGYVKKELNKQVALSLKDPKTIAGLTKDLNQEIIGRAADRLKGKLGSNAANFIKNNLKITNLKDAGNKYIITVKYPDPVSKKSLQIKSFNVIKQNGTISCPGNVKFKATIKTDYKMSGQTWLENENGSKTKKLNWSNGKNKTTTSTIQRSWNKNDFKSHSGWSRIVITYKDVFGKTHTKKSARANFKRACSKSATDSFKSNL